VTEYISSDLMAEQLALEGTKMVFGSPTSLGSPVLDALLERHQIKCIVASDEHTALNTAAGYAQASGLPGVVYLTAAPGLTMAMSGLYNAFQTRIPLVVLVEQQDTQIENRRRNLAHCSPGIP